MLTMLTLVAGAATCALLLWVFRGLTTAVQTHLMMLKIPAPPAANLLLGHVGILDSEHAPYLLQSIAKKLGPVFRLRLAHLPVVLVADPSEAQRLCSRGDTYLDKAPFTYGAFDAVHKDLKVHNILSSPTDEQWKVLRRATAPCFTSTNIKAALPLLVSIADTIRQQLEAAGPNHAWDFNDVCKRFTTDAITSWGFGQAVQASDDLTKENKLIGMVNNMFNAVHLVACEPLWQLLKWTPKIKTALRAFEVYDAWMADYVQRLKKRGSSLPPNCIGSALLGLDDPAVGGKLSDNWDLLKTNVAIFVAAGYETTANTMTIATLLLIKHPEWMERVEAELDAAGLLKTPALRDPRALAYSDLSQLPVLNAVIKETLRFMPSAALGTVRQARKEVQIGGYTVPAGTLVGFPPYIINNGALAYGQDAEKFKPDRWLTPGTMKKSSNGRAGDTQADATALSDDRLKEPFTFLTGPRDCIGQALAMMELQAFLCMLLSRFKIRLAPSMGTPEEAWGTVVYHVTFTMASGLWVTLEPR